MPFQVSPNVLVQERDVSLFVPQVATTAGAFVGHFNWGPAEEKHCMKSLASPIITLLNTGLLLPTS
jgi:hypothetical protein